MDSAWIGVIGVGIGAICGAGGTFAVAAFTERRRTQEKKAEREFQSAAQLRELYMGVSDLAGRVLAEAWRVRGSIGLMELMEVRWSGSAHEQMQELGHRMTQLRVMAPSDTRACIENLHQELLRVIPFLSAVLSSPQPIEMLRAQRALEDLDIEDRLAIASNAYQQFLALVRRDLKLEADAVIPSPSKGVAITSPSSEHLQ